MWCWSRFQHNAVAVSPVLPVWICVSSWDAMGRAIDTKRMAVISGRAVRRLTCVRGSLVLGTALLAGCSIQRLAMNSVSEMFASSGSVFEQDDDPALIADALPFGLKLMDALLVERPDDRALLLAAAQGYLLYAFAFVGLPADQLRLSNLRQASQLRERARSLYVRALSYAERAYALTPAEQMDAETLYWNAAALGSLISSSRDQPNLLARLPDVDALLAQALALDEAWDDGALHEFAIRLTGASSGAVDREALERHFERAVELSRGQRASVYVTFAESVAIREQDRALFIELLSEALRVDVDADPGSRLMNVVMQQRAQWLVDNIDQFIL
jgi:hypothetical protein